MNKNDMSLGRGIAIASIAISVAGVTALACYLLPKEIPSILGGAGLFSIFAIWLMC